jgi:hypothetical protein
MDGFVADAIGLKHNESNPISMFDRVSAPIINALAEEVIFLYYILANANSRPRETCSSPFLISGSVPSQGPRIRTVHLPWQVIPRRIRACTFHVHHAPLCRNKLGGSNKLQWYLVESAKLFRLPAPEWEKVLIHCAY